MKSKLIRHIKYLVLHCAMAIVLFSCEYKEIADAEYPEQLIYMPAAYSGFFVIDNVTLPTLAVPTPGEPYKYVVDLDGNVFNVPLSVYRSGINNKGGFTVDIAANTDTINSLITAARLPAGTIPLTPEKYSLVNSVEMEDGKEIATFDLEVNLGTLRNSFPNKVYALGIGITSTQRKTNPKMATTIVVIYTKMIKPTANFSSVADAGNAKIINFTSTGTYGVTFIWDFGDGSTVTGNSNLKPSHTYAASGTYNVILTVLGATGDIDKSVIAKPVTVL